jgi:hypothetical protein
MRENRSTIVNDLSVPLDCCKSSTVGLKDVLTELRVALRDLSEVIGNFCSFGDEESGL